MQKFFAHGMKNKVVGMQLKIQKQEEEARRR
jgi:hypothetical protein